MNFWQSFGQGFSPYAGKIGSELGQSIGKWARGSNVDKTLENKFANPEKPMDFKYNWDELSVPKAVNYPLNNLNAYKQMPPEKRADFFSGLDKISQKRIKDYLSINKINQPKTIRDSDLPTIWTEQNGILKNTKRKNPFYKPKSVDNFVKRFKNNLIDNAAKVNYLQSQLGQSYNIEADKEYRQNPLIQDINPNFNYKLNQQLGQSIQKGEITKRILESRIENELQPQTKNVLNEIENQLNQKFDEKKKENLQLDNNQVINNFSLKTLNNINQIEDYNLPLDQKAEIIANQYLKIKNQLPKSDYKLINQWFFAKYGKHLTETQAYQNYINKIKKNNE